MKSNFGLYVKSLMEIIISHGSNITLNSLIEYEVLKQKLRKQITFNVKLPFAAWQLIRTCLLTFMDKTRHGSTVLPLYRISEISAYN